MSNATGAGGVIDGICARAERGDLALTPAEFDALQEIVAAQERVLAEAAAVDAIVSGCSDGGIHVYEGTKPGRCYKCGRAEPVYCPECKAPNHGGYVTPGCASCTTPGAGVGRS